MEQMITLPLASGKIVDTLKYNTKLKAMIKVHQSIFFKKIPLLVPQVSLLHECRNTPPIYVYSRIFYLFGLGITDVLTSDVNLTM